MADGPFPRPGPWTGRAQTAEALVWLILARFLVGSVRFARWRSWLGSPIQTDEPTLEPGVSERRLARAVERAAGRWPFESKCLVRAMALHWMLKRRGYDSTLIIGALPETARGTLDDLHAWIAVGKGILMGGDAQDYRILARFRFTATT